jgi:hypothetical protein
MSKLRKLIDQHGLVGYPRRKFGIWCCGCGKIHKRSVKMYKGKPEQGDHCKDSIFHVYGSK